MLSFPRLTARCGANPKAVFIRLGAALFAVSASLQFATTAFADVSPGSGFMPAEVSLRADVKVGPGEPANDMLAGTLGLGWTIDDRWSVGLSLEHSPEFDVETPYAKFGVQRDEASDAAGTELSLHVFAERRYRRSADRYLFWTAGAGLGFIDVDDLQDTGDDGRQFDLSFDTGTEILVDITAGQRHRIAQRWWLGYGLRLEERFADWTITDRESGESIAIGDYFVYGAFFGARFAFD